ncbi:regulatory protein RecX [Branchiibius cervicis]|uniref:Regulatory protein RecX n=1 Tax=Branchiibius cervicis TaxID=908252 RepID=A0ABW2ARJ8_9MICO
MPGPQAGRPRSRSAAPERAADREPDPYDVARNIVLRQLTMAPRSRKQLEEKLRAKGCADEVAETVLDRMTEVGLVDDEAFAGMLVRSQQATRGLGRRGIAQELRRKGVDDELIRDQLDSIDDDAERDRAVELARKKVRTMRGAEYVVQQRRVAGMLARKGYSPSLVMSVVREVLQESADED